MNSKLCRSALTVAVLAGLAGCAAPAAAVPEPALPAANYAGPLTATTTYDKGTIALSAPAPTRTAAVSWSDAYTVNCRSGDAICDLNQSPTIVLAVATVNGAGQMQKDGSIAPLAKDTLVYVIRWTNVPCQPVGPVAPAGAKAPSPSVWSCTLVNLVDAGSGKVLYTIEGPDM
jgi:hypothetical protein